VPTDEAVGWVSVPAELQYGCAMGDYHHTLPCQCSNISISRDSKRLRVQDL
jgi:hypothetical protein